MNLPNFNGKAGELTRRSASFGKELVEFHYFLPYRLPNLAEFCGDISLMEKSNEANRAIGELQGIVKNIGNLRLFIDPYIRKEAINSSEIEGTFVSLTDVFLSEAGSRKPGIINPNVKEVVNFVKAIDFGILELKNGKKISEELINNMHGILLEGTRGFDRRTGEYRKQQNWIKVGGKTSDILDADFVPPSEEDVKSLMDYLFGSEAPILPR